MLLVRRRHGLSSSLLEILPSCYLGDKGSDRAGGEVDRNGRSDRMGEDEVPGGDRKERGGLTRCSRHFPPQAGLSLALLLSPNYR